MEWYPGLSGWQTERSTTLDLILIYKGNWLVIWKWWVTFGILNVENYILRQNLKRKRKKNLCLRKTVTTWWLWDCKRKNGQKVLENFLEWNHLYWLRNSYKKIWKDIQRDWSGCRNTLKCSQIWKGYIKEEVS